MTNRVPCEWCGAPIERTSLGRPPKYCRQSHRQRAYEARRNAERRGVGPNEVLVARHTWEALRDALYRLQTATEDVAMDIATGRATKADYLDAIAHLTEAVRGLQEISVEPVAMRPPDPASRDHIDSSL